MFFESPGGSQHRGRRGYGGGGVVAVHAGARHRHHHRHHHRHGRRH